MIIVNSITDRNAIPAADRTDGDAVYVTELGQMFHLRGGITNADWAGPSDWRTTANTNLYVNSGTGNDATGTGAVGAPYATITRAYKDVPSRIDHYVHIRIEDGSYTEFPDISNDFGSSGQLTFDGGEPTVYSGPHTIASSTEYGDGATIMQVFTVSGASWTPSEFVGKYLKITSGVWVESMHVVIENTADTVTIASPLYAVVATEVFNIVDVPVTVTLPANTTLSISGREKGKNYSPRIGIGSIKFATSSGSIMQVKDASICFHLCDVAMSTSAKCVELVDSVINPDTNNGGGWASQANSFDNIMSQYPGYCPTIFRSGSDSVTEAEITNILARALYFFSGVDAAGANTYSEIVSGYAHFAGSGNGTARYHYFTIYESSGGQDGFVTQYKGHLELYRCHIHDARDAIRLYENTSMNALAISCYTANIRYSIVMEANTKLSLASITAFAGTTGDIDFRFPSTSAAALPAVGASATDGHGARVTRR
jgi:hypothetical protein